MRFSLLQAQLMVRNPDLACAGNKLTLLLPNHCFYSFFRGISQLERRRKKASRERSQTGLETQMKPDQCALGAPFAFVGKWQRRNIRVRP